MLDGGAEYMRFEGFSFGSIQIDDITYEDDVVIDRGEVRKAQEKAFKEVSRGVWPHTFVR